MVIFQFKIYVAFFSTNQFQFQLPFLLKTTSFKLNHMLCEATAFLCNCEAVVVTFLVTFLQSNNVTSS